MAVVCKCLHCGEELGAVGGKCAKFCKGCGTAEKRAEMDKQNLELDPNFKCGYCERQKRLKVAEKKEE